MTSETDPNLKRCPRCEESLARSEFGICKDRRDGLNCYCKKCIREKMAEQRQNLRDYKQARKANKPKPAPALGTWSPYRIARLLRKMTPADRVREAIRLGARTQKEIVRVTRMSGDEVCECLAQLLLWTREIRTDVINHTRMYFVNEQGSGSSPRRQPVKPRAPRSYGVSTVYFRGEAA